MQVFGLSVEDASVWSGSRVYFLKSKLESTPQYCFFQYWHALYSKLVLFFRQVPGFVLDPVIFISIIYILTSLRDDIASIMMMYLIGIFTCNTAAACGRM